MRRYWIFAAKYLRQDRPGVFLLAAPLIGRIALRLSRPRVLVSFIDSALASSPPDILAGMAATYIGIAILEELVSASGQYLGVVVGQSACNRVRRDIFMHCIKLDMSFHKELRSGEMIERVDGDVNLLGSLFSVLIVGFAANIVLLCSVLVTLFRVSGVDPWGGPLCQDTFFDFLGGIVGLAYISFSPGYT